MKDSVTLSVNGGGGAQAIASSCTNGNSPTNPNTTCPSPAVIVSNKCSVGPGSHNSPHSQLMSSALTSPERMPSSPGSQSLNHAPTPPAKLLEPDLGNGLGNNRSNVTVTITGVPLSSLNGGPDHHGLNGGSHLRPSTNNNHRSPADLHLPENPESDEEELPVPGLSPKGGQMHCRIITAFTHAFAKQNVHFEKAIQSLDLLNEQIISYVFSPDAEAIHKDLDKNGGAKYSEAFKVSLALMRRLLLDAQGKFRKMVEENKALAGRLDGDLQSAHRQMALLRAELSDTNKRISQLSSPPSTPSTPNHESGSHSSYTNNTPTTGVGGTTSGNNGNCPSSKLPPEDLNNKTGAQVNGIQSNNNGLSNHDLEFIDSTSTVDLDSLSSSELRAECDKLLLQNGNLRKELAELRRASKGGQVTGSDGDILKAQDLQTELQHAKEALSGSLKKSFFNNRCYHNSQH
ncbi:unnamed protein product [Allacma fusca]|uniref:Uncharacterized protein n=1 Tax=Allacma fusca TaxID=39272 RepID=A0A8J2KE39_9HEXA|nr:unnamed protein product [Allacma fusca]